MLRGTLYIKRATELHLYCSTRHCIDNDWFTNINTAFAHRKIPLTDHEIQCVSCNNQFIVEPFISILNNVLKITNPNKIIEEFHKYLLSFGYLYHSDDKKEIVSTLNYLEKLHPIHITQVSNVSSGLGDPSIKNYLKNKIIYANLDEFKRDFVGIEDKKETIFATNNSSYAIPIYISPFVKTNIRKDPMESLNYLENRDNHFPISVENRFIEKFKLWTAN